MAQTVLMSNIFFWHHTGYFDPSSDTLPLLHTWSLAVEEQFYVMFPLLLIFLVRHKRLSLAKIILCLCLGSFELCIWESTLNPSANFYLLPSRAWELMMGALLVIFPGKKWSDQWLAETASATGFGLILYSILFYTRQTVFPGFAAIPPCLGASLIIYSGTVKSTFIGRMLALKPIVFIGLISYPLYLWHWPLLVFTKYIRIATQNWSLRVLLLLISVGLSILTYKLIETPFRRRMVCPRRSQILVFFVGAMLSLLVVGSLIDFKQGLSSRLPAQARVFLSRRFDTTFWKGVWPMQAAAGQFPELGAQSTNQPIEILLWGDSHAMAVAPALDELCRRYSVRGVQATHISTAPILEYFQHERLGLNENAPEFSQSVVDFVVKQHIKKVVMAANWANYAPPEEVNTKLSVTIQVLIAAGAPGLYS